MRTQEHLNECREEVQRLTRENIQLKERLQNQEDELIQQKAMVNRVEVGQPSITSSASNAMQVGPLSCEMLGELWSWEAKRPTTQSILQMYELQSQFLFLTTGLKKFAWVNHTIFQQI